MGYGGCRAGRRSIASVPMHAYAHAHTPPCKIPSVILTYRGHLSYREGTLTIIIALCYNYTMESGDRTLITHRALVCGDVRHVQKAFQHRPAWWLLGGVVVTPRPTTVSVPRAVAAVTLGSRYRARLAAYAGTTTPDNNHHTKHTRIFVRG